MHQEFASYAKISSPGVVSLLPSIFFHAAKPLIHAYLAVGLDAVD